MALNLSRVCNYLFPNKTPSIQFPIFLSHPCLLNGMPVSWAIFCFACVIPSARFHENERPGIRGVLFVI